MSRSRGTRTQSSGHKPKTETAIRTAEMIDASASCSVSIRNTKNDTEEVYTKEFYMSGLSDIAPKSPETSAKITVSFDLSSKSYGNGAAVMCSITLNCAQNEESVSMGYEMARAICEEEGAAALSRARETFDRVMRES